MPTYRLDLIVDGKDNGASSVLNGISGTLGGLTKALAGLAVAATGLAVGGLAAAVKSAAGFESTMSGVQAVLSPTADEFAALGDLALRLGKDTNFGASEAAEGIEMLAKNGLNATQIMNGAADATLALAAATGLKGGEGLATAADIATNAMSVFKIKAEDMSTAVDGITAVTVASQFEIGDYKLALSQAGATAAAVGVEFDDFNTTIAAISPAFASGSDAGTSFKTLLQRLVPVSGPAAGAMQKLGLLTFDLAEASRQLGVPQDQVHARLVEMTKALSGAEEGTDAFNKQYAKLTKKFQSNAFFDANGNLKDMAEVAQVLQDAMAGLSEHDAIDLFTEAFGTDAQRAAFALADSGSETFRKLAASMGEVDAAAQAATRLDNLSGDIEQLKGSAETLGIELGTAFLPVMRQLVQVATDFLNTNLLGRDWSPLVTGVQSAIGAVTGFAATVQAAGGPLAFLRGQLSGLADWTVAQLPVWRDSFIQWATATWQWVGPAIPRALAALLDLRNQAVQWALQNAPALVDALRTWSLALLDWVVKGLPGMLGLLVDGTLKLLDIIIQFAPPLIAALAKWAAALIDWIIDAAPGLFGELLKLVGRVVDWIIDRAPTIGAQLARWAEAFLQWVGPAASRLILALGDMVGQLLTWLVQQAPRFASNLNSWMESAGQWIETTGWPLLLTALTTLATNIWNKIRELGDQARSEGTIGAALIEGIRNGVSGAWNGLTTWLNDRWSDLIRGVKFMFGINSPSTVFAEIGRFLLEGMLQGLYNGLGSILDFATGIGMLMEGKLREWVGSMADTGRMLVGGIWSGLQEKWTWMVGQIQGLAQMLPQGVRDILGIHSPSRVFALQVGRYIPEGIAQGALQAAPVAIQAVQSIATDLLPTTPLAGAQTAISAAPAAARGGDIYYITVPVQGSVVAQRDLEDALYEALIDRRKRSGPLGLD